MIVIRSPLRARALYSLRHVKRQLSSTTNSQQQSSLATQPFQRLVETLKSSTQTCTIIESSCGGLISSSLMSVPGSSRVYFGGTVAYSTKRAGKLLCGDEELHDRLLKSTSPAASDDDNMIVGVEEHLSEETKAYIQSKVKWTQEAALSYCKHMDTDFTIAEGGATGPTFHPEGMKAGFAVLAVAGRRSGQDDVEILAQKLVLSTHGDREMNMRLYADAAAELCVEAMNIANPSIEMTTEQPDTNQVQSTNVTDKLYLDRSSHLRSDAEVMKELYNRSDAQHVIVKGASEVLLGSDDQLSLPTLEQPFLGTLFETDDAKKEALENRTFLGRLGDEQTPLFAMYLPEDTNVSSDSNNSYFANTRSRAPMLSPLHNEIALTATAYVNWRDSHRFCTRCGSPVEFVQGGTCAKCTSGHMAWPRQDPSIIVLVTNAESTHALLARSPRHPSYLYTALAGFVEPGENMETAVAREVHEEVGVNVNHHSINYISSQAWPFPQSCMIGFHAKTNAADGLASINIDPEEIVDARWFEKEDVYLAARDTDMMGAVLDRQVVEAQQANGNWTGSLLVPSKGVLARTLVDHWLEE
ncbi:NAD-capped RNA hydrolase NUDT12 [Skeletonema marinoi]|uniref:NAD(+) diphosphatase n=1 Tax=Skeletonema marinoi TaxID=267567 RepID=A0AAD9DAR6_9STRA|nr:NAD-capped RNA hydrolase NUDT12 [Skeletonema marinoi]